MTTRLAAIWDETLAQINAENRSPGFDGWLHSIKPVGLYEDTIVLACPNDFARQWLEQRCAGVLGKALSGVLEREVKVDFVTDSDLAPGPVNVPQDIVSDPDTAPARPKTTEKPGGGQERADEAAAAPWRTLRRRYTFESFVVGSSNRFAHAATKAVADSPARVYNPLFIYGGVGLGKTHLLQAIAHQVIAQKPRAKVAYVSSEAFTNELIDSIRAGTASGFRSRYRNAELLLVDDVQFIAGKEATQEEFFHTFNALHEASKQIVLTSDRPPKEILTLEERLRSRFEWGLIADIQAPDFETRVAILRKKALTDELAVPDEVLHLIASKFDSNIRELEGALVRVVALATLSDAGLSVEVAARALRDIAPNSRPQPTTLEIIIRTVAEYYRLSSHEIIARGRTKSVAFARQVAMYLARELTDQSLPKIGQAFGGRDHTTVLHAYDKIKQGLEQDPILYGVVRELTDKVRPS